MSKIAMLDNAKVAGIVANMMAPQSPTLAPNRTVPTHRVRPNNASVAIAVGSRAANSLSPSSRMERPCSQ
jgi:hypothetical protein